MKSGRSACLPPRVVPASPLATEEGCFEPALPIVRCNTHFPFARASFRVDAVETVCDDFYFCLCDKVAFGFFDSEFIRRYFQIYLGRKTVARRD